jgi:ABC-type multidrug transport system ATPase subunit
MNGIAFHKVTKRFGRLCALDEVSLGIDPAQAILLAGPNGAGKSTLINILLGLYLPDHGELRVDGPRVRADNQLKSRMGYLPENVAFSENLSAWTLLLFFARARGVGRKRIHAVLERIGLSQHARRSVSGYSKGMRQRLALGIAILHEPDILILDEPTSGLDQEGLGVLWSVIDEWRENNRLTVISSHDLGILEKRVDAICILRKGKLLASDTPQALREKTSLPVSVDLTFKDETDTDNGSTDVTTFLEQLRREFPKQKIEHDQRSLCIEIEQDRLLDLMATAFSQHQQQGQQSGQERGQAFESMRVREPELEDVYEHLLETA